MKKIYILLFILLFLPFDIFALEEVTLQREQVPDVWFTRTGGGKPYESYYFENYSVNGQVVYCIQPSVIITTNNYIGENGFSYSPYSDAINQKLELIGYYGYDYPGHQTLKYRMATQALIWELANGQTVEYYTKRYGYGDYIDITNERNEINRLVNNHDKKPSFNGKTVDIIVGQEMFLEDNSNVLSDYEIVSNDNLEAKMQENKLYVKPLTPGNLSVKLKRKKHDNLITKVYKGDNDNSQQIGLFRVPEEIIDVDITAKCGQVELTHFDVDTRNNTSISPFGTLVGAEYGIYDLEGNLITKLVIDSQSKAQSAKCLNYGNYYVQEILASEGYQSDINKYYFKVTDENYDIKMNIYSKIISKDIIITKKYLINQNLMPEKNIVFGIYDLNDNLIFQTETNEFGVSIINLNYGSYKLKQLTTTSGYDKVEEILLTTNQFYSDTIKYDLINYPLEETKEESNQKTITVDVPNTESNVNMFFVLISVIGLMGMLLLTKNAK